MSNPNFNPSMSTNEIWRDLDDTRCLTDDLDTIESDITALETGKADATHTHTGYAASTHTHTGYAASTHTHSGYALATDVDALEAKVGDTTVSAQISAAIASKADADHTHTGYAASSHSHSASNITSGTLPIARGGTGATTAAAALQALGLTATATELNKMDGVTATTAELNYVDGVTSNIQTQLNAKAASSHSHNAATTSAAGLMSAADKVKLDGIATNANKTTVDSALSTTSANPVQNKIVTAQLNSLSALVGNTTVAAQISAAIADKVDAVTALSAVNLNTITEPGLYYLGSETAELNCPAGSNGHMLVMSDGSRTRQIFFRFGTINTNNFQWYSRSRGADTTVGNEGWSEWWLLSGSELVFNGTATLNTEINLGSRYGCQAWVIAGNVTNTGTVSTIYIPRYFLTTNQTKYKLQIADESGYVSFYFYYKTNDDNVYAKVVWVSDIDNSAIKYAYRIS